MTRNSQDVPKQRGSPKIGQLKLGIKKKIWWHFSNLEQRTFKSLSGTHRGLLNHVKKELLKNSNSFIVSRLTNVATPSPLHDLWHIDIHSFVEFLQILFYVVQIQNALYDCLTEFCRKSYQNWNNDRIFLFSDSADFDAIAISEASVADNHVWELAKEAEDGKIINHGSYNSTCPYVG